MDDIAIDARLVKEVLEKDDSRIFILQRAPNTNEALRSLANGMHQFNRFNLDLPEARGPQTLRYVMPLAESASDLVIAARENAELRIVALREAL